MNETTKITVYESLNSSYESKYGTLWKFRTECENGSKGEHSSKNQDGTFKVGDEVIATVVPSNNDYPDKIKLERPKEDGQGYGGGFAGGVKKGGYVESPEKQAIILAQSSFERAVSLYSMMDEEQLKAHHSTDKPNDPVTVCTKIALKVASNIITMRDKLKDKLN